MPGSPLDFFGALADYLGPSDETTQQLWRDFQGIQAPQQAIDRGPQQFSDTELAALADVQKQFAPQQFDTEAAALADMQGFHENPLFGPPAMYSTDELLPYSNSQSQSDVLRLPSTGQASSQQSPGILGGLSSFWNQLNQPGGTQYNPKPSDLEQLLGAGAALLGGGSPMEMLGTAGGINAYQQLATTRDHNIELQNRRNEQILQDASPQGQMQKTQRAIFQSRLNGDVNQFVKAKASDVNNAIPQQEWENAWQQIRTQYAPLGLDPGPSPFEMQWESAKNASPEFRNATVVQQTKDTYGDSEGEMMGVLLQGDPTGRQAAQYKLQLEKERTQRAKIISNHKNEQMKLDAALVEDYRKRDLEAGKGLGEAAGQFSGAKGNIPSMDHLAVQSAINAHYDSQLEGLRSGTLQSPRQFFSGGLPANLDKKTYPTFAKSLAGQAKAHGDILQVPVNAKPPLTIDMKARAIAVPDNATAESMNVPPGQSVLVQVNGRYFWVDAKPAI